ncbi:hypothetical protein ACIRCZ_18825 [Leifsonia sp. NPDC102414]|uniref:hypothetical protein n=1 Tax=Leifsonia sp. NPDC102414 TaxID=3364124 RepID=UPI00382558AE
MDELPVSGVIEVKAGLSAQVSVQYTGGWGWEARWLLVTKYLARLQDIYEGAQIESNTDLWAIMNSLLIDANHLGEAFSHQLALAKEVRTVMKSSAELRICRDYANTWKHFKRDGSNARVAYIWEDGTTRAGHYVTIAHRLQNDPPESQTTIDGLELARGAWQAWRAFMSDNGVEEPIGLTQPYLEKLIDHDVARINQG